jgi:transcriptional regulator of arginine metabolism
MTKQARHYAIKEIINRMPIANQGELLRELRKRRCIVTQATLSRDLQDIGIGRVHGRYMLQRTQEIQVLRPLVGVEVVSIEANEHMIVVHTLPGGANTVGEFVDGLRSPDIIGTVAGDNTLLVVPRLLSKTKVVLQFLKDKLIEGT